MKKNLFLTLVVLAVGILIASMVTAQTARVAVPYAVEPLLGSSEFPGPGDADGTGTAAVTIDVDTDDVCLNVSALANVDLPITAAHIHSGVVGADGPPLVSFLAADDADGIFSVCIIDADADGIAADPAGFYVNLHNAVFPGGAVRGQLIAPAVPTDTPTDVVVETATATATDVVVETATATATEGTPVATETATEGTPVATATPTTIAPIPGDLIVNGGFETELTAWTLKNAVGDKVKTNKADKVFAYEGSSAFKFKGSAGENTSLSQVPDITAVVFGVNDTLDLNAYIGAKKATADGKFKVVVKYSDTTEVSKDTVAIAQTTDGVYTLVTGQVTLISSAVEKVKLLIKHKSVNGKVYVDAVSLALVDQPDPTPTSIPTETATVDTTVTATVTVAATETATTAASDLVPLP